MALEFLVEGLYGPDARKWDYVGSEDTREDADALKADYERNEPQYTFRVRRNEEFDEVDEDPDEEPTYKIVRHFQNRDNEVIERGLTLEEAQAHCQDDESSSSTATGAEAMMVTESYGAWFDGYTEE
jgi:hypothetical protein